MGRILEQIDIPTSSYYKGFLKKEKKRYLRRKYRQNEWQYFYALNMDDVTNEIPPSNKCYEGWLY